jgi:hypothetical protein
LLSSISRLFSELPKLITNFKGNNSYINFKISPYSIMSSPTKKEISHEERKTNQYTEGLLDLTESIRVVILENLLHERKLKCLRYSSHLHLQKRLSWKYSTVLTKVVLRSLKVMKIVRTVKVNHHPSFMVSISATIWDRWQ